MALRSLLFRANFCLQGRRENGLIFKRWGVMESFRTKNKSKDYVITWGESEKSYRGTFLSSRRGIGIWFNGKVDQHLFSLLCICILILNCVLWQIPNWQTKHRSENWNLNGLQHLKGGYEEVSPDGKAPYEKRRRVRRRRPRRRSRRRWRGRTETGEEGRESGASIPAARITIKTRWRKKKQFIIFQLSSYRASPAC